MNKKAILVIGPGLVLINFFALLFGALKVMTAFGLVSGILFRKELTKKEILVKAGLISLLIVATITAVHFMIGPLGNHHLFMLIASAPFFTMLSLLSWNSYKNNFRMALLESLLVTLIFIVISQMGVALARW
ncbi:MAG: hypothetical protein HGA85_05910 [Nanoarchaeota archaeon]|nr:hypothetical protein [Nanoarchaeota archaeon]